MTTHSLNIATAPVNWNNNDIPDWRTPEPFPDILDRMIDAGYRATEYDDKIGPDPDIVGVAARERGIDLCGFYQWIDLQDDRTFDADIAALTPRLEQLREIGCRHLVIADRMRPERDAIAGRVPEDGSAGLERNAFLALVQRADRVATIAAGFGFATHYHNHVGTFVETPVEVGTFAEMAKGRSIDFCFDTGHYAYAGGDALAFVRSNVGVIGHLHLKDVDTNILTASRVAGEGFKAALRRVVFPPIGEGNAAIPAIIQVLARAEFANWVVIEQDTCNGDSTDTARSNRLAVEGFIAEAERISHD